MQLLLRMNSAFFVANSLVASCRDPADRLMIVVSGLVRCVRVRVGMQACGYVRVFQCLRAHAGARRHLQFCAHMHS